MKLNSATAPTQEKTAFGKLIEERRCSSQVNPQRYTNITANHPGSNRCSVPAPLPSPQTSLPSLPNLRRLQPSRRAENGAQLKLTDSPSVEIVDTGASKLTEGGRYVVTANTPRDELYGIITQLQADLVQRTDSVNAIQRNFERLSRRYREEQVGKEAAAAAMQAQLAAIQQELERQVARSTALEVSHEAEVAQHHSDLSFLAIVVEEDQYRVQLLAEEAAAFVSFQEHQIEVYRRLTVVASAREESVWRQCFAAVVQHAEDLQEALSSVDMSEANKALPERHGQSREFMSSTAPAPASIEAMLARSLESTKMYINELRCEKNTAHDSAWKQMRQQALHREAAAEFQSRQLFYWAFDMVQALRQSWHHHVSLQEGCHQQSMQDLREQAQRRTQQQEERAAELLQAMGCHAEDVSLAVCRLEQQKLDAFLCAAGEVSQSGLSVLQETLRMQDDVTNQLQQTMDSHERSWAKQSAALTAEHERHLKAAQSFADAALIDEASRRAAVEQRCVELQAELSTLREEYAAFQQRAANATAVAAEKAEQDRARLYGQQAAVLTAEAEGRLRLLCDTNEELIRTYAVWHHGAAEKMVELAVRGNQKAWRQQLQEAQSVSSLASAEAAARAALVRGEGAERSDCSMLHLQSKAAVEKALYAHSFELALATHERQCTEAVATRDEQLRVLQQRFHTESALRLEAQVRLDDALDATHAAVEAHDALQKEMASSSAFISSSLRRVEIADKSSESACCCSICLQLFEHPVACVPCGHAFCAKCLLSSVNRRPAGTASTSTSSSFTAAANQLDEAGDATALLFQRLRVGSGGKLPKCPECNHGAISTIVELPRLAELSSKLQYRRRNIMELLSRMTTGA